MWTIGYDIGSSSVKCMVFDAENSVVVASDSMPEKEMPIKAPYFGYAEQDPELWWGILVKLTKKMLYGNPQYAEKIKAVGITYQMHGLVIVDNTLSTIRPSIIWCDSRAVNIGEKAFIFLGKEYCLNHLLNSPGNFTASKLAWVRENEPHIYRKIYKAMLPGDFISMKLTGEINTSFTGLTEGIFWDFAENTLAEKLLEYLQIEKRIIPEPKYSFETFGYLSRKASEATGLMAGIPLCYKAGDQPNNAFSLNVLNPGEIAATAGTSGVIYGVTDKEIYDKDSRINIFAHVNHGEKMKRLGVLLCINGCGIQNSWLKKNIVQPGFDYPEMNRLASEIEAGSGGLTVLPFGNGAERIFGNKNIGGHIMGVDFNRMSRAHMMRAAQEGIAFAFNYGTEILQNMGVDIKVIRAGKANMFLSPVFTSTLSGILNVPIEIYNTDGAQGAARGAAVGAGYYSELSQSFTSLERVALIEPENNIQKALNESYELWKSKLQKLIYN